VCCADPGKAHELVTLNVNFVHNMAAVAVDHIAVVRHSVVLSVLLFCSRNYIMRFVVNTKHVALLTVTTVRTAPSLQLITALASTSIYVIAISRCFIAYSCYHLASTSKFYATW
jgi:hypothetical protein